MLFATDSHMIVWSIQKFKMIIYDRHVFAGCIVILLYGDEHYLCAHSFVNLSLMLQKDCCRLYEVTLSMMQTFAKYNIGNWFSTVALIYCHFLCCILYENGGGGGRSGTVGGRSPGFFVWVLPKRSIPKPDTHRIDYTMWVVRHWYVIGTDEQQLHKISHWTVK